MIGRRECGVVSPRAESNNRPVSIMKTWLGCLVVGFLAAGGLFATPDHAVDVKERFFGSNATDYAVLRTEDDNQASYYQHRVKTWLDEYSKEDALRNNVKSTLLLDVGYIGTRIRSRTRRRPR